MASTAFALARPKQGSKLLSNGLLSLSPPSHPPICELIIPRPCISVARAPKHAAAWPLLFFKGPPSPLPPNAHGEHMLDESTLCSLARCVLAQFQWNESILAGLGWAGARRLAWPAAQLRRLFPRRWTCAHVGAVDTALDGRA